MVSNRGQFSVLHELGDDSAKAIVRDQEISFRSGRLYLATDGRVM